MQILQKLRSKEPIYVNKSILLTPNSLLIGILSLTTKIDGQKLTQSGFSLYQQHLTNPILEHIK